MTRILCTGDTQLGVGTVALQDQTAVLNRIADEAIAQGCDLVLHGGDVFQGPTIAPEHLDTFAAFVTRLRNHAIPLVAISGNGSHDAAMRTVNGLAIFDHIPGVTISSHPEVLHHDGLAICTLPWVHPGRLIAQAGGGDRHQIHQQAAEHLIATARDLRAHAGDGPAILLCHWSISGASLPSGLPVEQAREPILDRDQLAQLGYQAVVASHIHKAQLVSTGLLVENENGSHVTDPACRIFYTGSPQPLNHGEAGYPHGVWILDTGEDSVEFVEVESRRFVTIDIGATEAEEISDRDADLGFWPESVPDGAIVRVRYTATQEQARRIDPQRIRQVLADLGASRVTIEPEIIREDRARVHGVDEQLGELQALDLWLTAQGMNGHLADAMRALTARYLETVVS